MVFITLKIFYVSICLVISTFQGKSQLQSACESVLADLQRCQLEVSTNLDVTDHINVLLVWKLEFMVIRKFHFKHISSQLQHNLKMENRENLKERNFCTRLVIAVRLREWAHAPVTAFLQNTSQDFSTNLSYLNFLAPV